MLLFRRRKARVENQKIWDSNLGADWWEGVENQKKNTFLVFGFRRPDWTDLSELFLESVVFFSSKHLGYGEIPTL